MECNVIETMLSANHITQRRRMDCGGLRLAAARNQCSSPVLLYVHRDHKDYSGRGAQDGHLDFHTAPELCKTMLSAALVK